MRGSGAAASRGGGWRLGQGFRVLTKSSFLPQVFSSQFPLNHSLALCGALYVFYFTLNIFLNLRIIGAYNLQTQQQTPGEMAETGEGDYFWGITWLEGNELLYDTADLLMLSFSDKNKLIFKIKWHRDSENFFAGQPTGFNDNYRASNSSRPASDQIYSPTPSCRMEKYVHGAQHCWARRMHSINIY